MSIPKLHVVGDSVKAIHALTTVNRIPWHRVVPVTSAEELRTKPGQGTIHVLATRAALDTLPPGKRAAIRLQLSIRRALGNLAEVSGSDRSLTHWRERPQP